MQKMKAFTRQIYGGPDVLSLSEVHKPIVSDGQILVRIMANSANPADWHILRGDPYFARLTYGLFRPKYKIPGSDFSGVVESVGRGVTGFKVGDHVFGSTLLGGAFAEYISIPAAACAHMPDCTDFVDMACIPIAGLTALQALTTHGDLKVGETVLINGAAGGVGHFAVQIAKSLGAKVTAVCSGKNASFVKSLGADNIVAYDNEDVQSHNMKYDLVVDVNGNLSYRDYQRMGRRGVMIGFTNMKHMLTLLLKAKSGNISIKNFTVAINTNSLEEVASLVQNRRIMPNIDKIFSFEQVPEALAYIERMRTRGKVAIVWEHSKHPNKIC